MIIVALILGYFAPTYIGIVSGNPRAIDLFCLNVAIGWTVVGWLATFVIACEEW